MTIVLPVNKNKVRKKTRTLGTVQRPPGVRKSYQSALLSITEVLKASLVQINESLAGQNSSAVGASSAIENQFQTSLTAINNQGRGSASQFVSQSNSVNRKSIESIYKTAFSVNSARLLDQPNIQDELNLALTENVSLIRSIHNDFWSKVAQAVTANFRGQDQIGNVTLQKRLQDIGGISDTRAKIIARDQTKKLSTSLTRLRHKNVGVKKYIWRNVQDQRVVGNPAGLYPKGSSIHLNHWEREGKIFYYDRPPADGHPGTAILCRCYEEPILDIDNADIVNSSA